MDDVFLMRSGDLSPVFETQLTPLTDLIGATVFFRLRDRAGAALVDGAATVAGDPALGVVQYPWNPGDTDFEGVAFGFVDVTYGDNTTETFPNFGDGYPFLFSKAV
jgi:hypothetical protein